MTLQEMFNLAARGLRAQKFERSMRMLPLTGLKCCYDDGFGLRCAWGHVDSSLKDETLSVEDLHMKNIGVAGSLSKEDLVFAEALQSAHDRGENPREMHCSLKALATDFNLSDEELGPQPKSSEETL